MHDMKKRILSLLLAIVMVVSLIPTTAFAVADTQGASAEQANPFADVKETDWFYDAVQYARINGFFSGTSKTTFAPNGTMTRGMFVTVLGRMAGVDADRYQSVSSFSDVPADAYYAPYVAWAVKHGGHGWYGRREVLPQCAHQPGADGSIFCALF